MKCETCNPDQAGLIPPPPKEVLGEGRLPFFIRRIGPPVQRRAIDENH